MLISAGNHDASVRDVYVPVIGDGSGTCCINVWRRSFAREEISRSSLVVISSLKACSAADVN